MIEHLTNADALPVLERVMQFAGARHRVLTHNVANIDTPGFRAVDLSVEDFRAALSEAVDERRTAGAASAGLPDFATDDVRFEGDVMRLDPQPANQNLLFHDGNDRDVERTMQSIVENFLVFRAAADLMRQQMDLLASAVSERV